MIPPSDNPDLADEILATMHRLCLELDITLVLYAGTALGFVRDGTYIVGDNDIDVGLLCDKDQFNQLTAALSSNGFIASTLPPYDTMHFYKNNMLLDIRGSYDWGPELEIPRCVLPCLDPLDTITYNGLTYNIPGPHEKHFDCLYGSNWRTPRPKKSTVVFAPVCADPLHIGHVRWLEKAAALGSLLVAGVCTDEFIESFKNPPVIPYEQRREVVAALRCVDYTEPLTAFDDYSAIEEHHATIYVVDDLFPSYEEETLAKIELLEKGITYVVVPRTPEVSSSQIKEACCHSLCHSGDCCHQSVRLQCAK